MEVTRPTDASDALWTGAMALGADTMAFEIATYQYADGPALIIRTRAWHLLTAFDASGGALAFSWDEGEQAPPAALDLSILASARTRIPDESAWDREDDRDCENDVGGRISVYCALAGATREAMGRYQHRQPAMQAVRRVIRSEWPERVVSHRLMDFNNDPRTTLGDVERLFQLAEDLIRPSIR